MQSMGTGLGTVERGAVKTQFDRIFEMFETQEDQNIYDSVIWFLSICFAPHLIKSETLGKIGFKCFMAVHGAWLRKE